MKLTVPAYAVQLWWPHELRPLNQSQSRLYRLNISLENSSGAVADVDSHSNPDDIHQEFAATITRRVGFRVAELVQDPPKQGTGTLWQWRINGILLYIRGANIIPFDALTTRSRVGRSEFSSILGSAVAALIPYMNQHSHAHTS